MEFILSVLLVRCSKFTMVGEGLLGLVCQLDRGHNSQFRHDAADELWGREFTVLWEVADAGNVDLPIVLHPI